MYLPEDAGELPEDGRKPTHGPQRVLGVAQAQVREGRVRQELHGADRA